MQRNQGTKQLTALDLVLKNSQSASLWFIEEAKVANFNCRHVDKLQDDVRDFGFILLESLVGPITSEKGEAFVLLNEMVSTYVCFEFDRLVVYSTVIV